MLGWLVHLCIFRMKTSFAICAFNFRLSYFVFIQLPLGWLAWHPRAFADCPPLCNSPLRCSCSLHLLFLLSNLPDFPGGFITTLEKVFWWIQDTSSATAIRGHQQSRNRSPGKPSEQAISALFELFYPFRHKNWPFVVGLLLSHKEEKFSLLAALFRLSHLFFDDLCQFRTKFRMISC